MSGRGHKPLLLLWLPGCCNMMRVVLWVWCIGYHGSTSCTRVLLLYSSSSWCSSHHRRCSACCSCSCSSYRCGVILSCYSPTRCHYNPSGGTLCLMRGRSRSGGGGDWGSCVIYISVPPYHTTSTTRLWWERVWWVAGGSGGVIGGYDGPSLGHVVDGHHRGGTVFVVVGRYHGRYATLCGGRRGGGGRR